MQRLWTSAGKSSPFKFKALIHSALAKKIHLPPIPTPQSDLYLPGSEIQLKFQAPDSPIVQPLSVKIIKRLEPFTSSAVLLSQRTSDNKQFILKLNDRRVGFRSSLNMDGEFPWTPDLEERLRAAVREIDNGTKTHWFESVKDRMNPALPCPSDWEDWMWEIFTWTLRMERQESEVEAYRLLRKLQGFLIPRFIGLVTLPISSEEPHPITNCVPGIVIEYIQGESLGSLKPDVNIPRSEAEAIADAVMDAFRILKAQKCVIHNDIHIDNIILRHSDRSPVIIDLGCALTRESSMSDSEEWEASIAGNDDMRAVRNMLTSKEHGVWRRKETPLPMHYYHTLLAWNKYVENQPEDYRKQTFERVPDTDGEGAREKVLQWRLRPGIQRRE
ncbi:uncharacterized protein EV420DRAFT_340818 [Desarmillaria tabescens]|uniref:Protein kinase domain-containing protein n=1 Tax=Armillaria tabescens TaxID=1929756 RepID=A0AA39KFD0_ARMTA|nr:uncharacterized protein EV420DRAFT_340818 [Desarmillaria tabescens]KAK0458940.1 hypothetical protein EV420DRAFT_340818 [Desarmillaria tabescens]